MRKFIWAPGYIFIALLYFFPTEIGKSRNVSRGGRWWKYKDRIAPIISILFYLFLVFCLIHSGAN